MKADKPTRTAKPEEPAKNVIYLADYRRKKDEVKAVFKDSLDNKQVMQRYNINQPTLEERQERIKESIQRINKLMAEIKQ